MKIAGVRYRDNPRVYDFDATGVELGVGDLVIVESERGLGFARVVRLREAEALPLSPQTAKDQQQERSGKQPKENAAEEEIEIEVETPGDVAAAAAAAAMAATGAAAAAPPPATDRPKQPPKGHRKVVRKATEDDLQRAEKNRAREAEAFK